MDKLDEWSLTKDLVVVSKAFLGRIAKELHYQRNLCADLLNKPFFSCSENDLVLHRTITQL